MITHLRGTMTFKCPTFVVLEAGGVGYQVFISLHTYSQLPDTPTIFLLTHQFIKEDSHTLYGFSEDKERTLFRLLISVSGVGPTTAQVLLSSISPDEIRLAILSEQDEIFRKAKGIGPKTAKRIILDLKEIYLMGLIHLRKRKDILKYFSAKSKSLKSDLFIKNLIRHHQRIL